jgi:hypothetical protein
MRSCELKLNKNLGIDLQKRAIFIVFLIAILLAVTLQDTIGLNYYPPNYLWNFQNSTYLSFNAPVNFSSIPQQGVTWSSNTVAYWRFDDSSVSTIVDSTGNGNNGTLYNATFTDGKNGKAASFDGVNSYYNASTSHQFGFGSGSFSVAMWLYLRGNYGDLIGQYSSGQTGIWALSFRDSTNMQFYQQSGGNSPRFNVKNCQNQWCQYVFVFDNQFGQLSVYQDGVRQSSVAYIQQNFTSSVPLTISKFTSAQWGNLDAIIDDVCIYNDALSNSQIEQLFTTSTYPTPDPVSYRQYFNFTDPYTNNTLLIHAYNPSIGNSDSCLVTVTNFFNSNSIELISNATVQINLWTNLGQPVFTNGYWNSQNWTTSLTLADSAIGTLKWNKFKIISSSDGYSTISPIGEVLLNMGSSQTFDFSTAEGYRIGNVNVDGFSVGSPSNYTFYDITANHTISVMATSSTFSIKASAGQGGKISPNGQIIVNFGNNATFSIVPNSNYTIADVIIDDSTVGKLSSYTFSNITSNHTITASFTAYTPAPTPSTNQSVGLLVSINTIGNIMPGQNKTITVNLAFLGSAFNVTRLSFQGLGSDWMYDSSGLPAVFTLGTGLFYTTLNIPINASAGNYEIQLMVSGEDSSGASQSSNASLNFTVVLPNTGQQNESSILSLFDKPLLIVALIVLVLGIGIFYKKSCRKHNPIQSNQPQI